MIDIIIPAYNAHKTILKTLISIYMQTYREKIIVYIVDDNSENDYSREKSLFDNRLKIINLKTPKNGGPGVARQYGIDHSNSEYIMFIDSDDVFYDCFSVENLVQPLESENADMAFGTIFEETEDEINKYVNHQGCLHGKVYKRELLKKHNIRFNDTRSSEDNSFNRLCYIASNKIANTENLIYLHKYNCESLTHKDENYDFNSLKWYIYNICWTEKNATSRNLDNKKIAEAVFSAIYYIYFVYLSYNDDAKKSTLLLWAHDLYDLYYKYDKYLDEHEKYEIYVGYAYDCIPSISVSEFFRQIKLIGGII